MGAKKKTTSRSPPVKETKCKSYVVGECPKSADLTAQGKNVFLFVTGLSNRTHPYATDDPRQEGDAVWANELKVANKKDVVEESKRSLAEGCAIIGGDPLTRMDRTTGYVKLLKKEFGEIYHVHLKTFLDSITDLKMQRLAAVGIDEIFFFPDLDNHRSWKKLRFARKHEWKVGVIVPSLPDRHEKIKKLVEQQAENIDYVVFQDMESETAKLRADIKDLMKVCGKNKISAYYFPRKRKEMHELKSRLNRRAKNLARPFDKITTKGTLVRAALYLPSLMPSEDYELKLQTIKKNEYLKRLYRIKRELSQVLKAKFGSIEVDREKMRILAQVELVKKGVKKVKNLNLIPAIVEEYPTADGRQQKLEFL